MPPTDTPTPETPTPAAPEPPQKERSWRRLANRANSISGVITLLVTVLIIGGAIGFGISLLRSPDNTKKTTIQTLTAEELRKLSDISTGLGNSNQVLSIGANASFRGKADIAGDLTVGGRFNANGPVTLSQLNITGTTALTGLNVGSNLIVSGTTTLQQGLTVTGLAAITGGLNVSGTISANALNVTTASVQTISISGPLTIGHLRTQGTTPTAAAGSVGAGGTVSISGNDTAGTINLNTGGSPAAQTTLITVTFRAAYSSAPHVLLSARSAAGANAGAYVIPTTTGFRILATTPPAGSTLSFDYFVTQ